MLANQLGKVLINEKINISITISNYLDKRYNEFLDTSNLQNQAIVNWRAELIGYIGQALINNHIQDVMEMVTQWATQTAEGAVQYNIGIDELLQTNKVYRAAIWDFVKEMETEEIKVETFLKINKVIDTILDHTAYVYGTSFVKYQENLLRLANEASLAISTPVVKINKRIAILPLVGSIDTHRAEVLKETSIKRAVELKITELYIDLSGVPFVDTMVANELFQVAKALTLIGVKPTFTGIRPEIAQAVVSFGIDFKDIETLGTLEQALSNIIK
ncbi:STAS domain-containing protein [Peribacillus sp. SCS-37]|uniref:STAS domain-containing protein n=1 Tax=Paraperibacillus esterisolvens TaxID=3115296 RepID=UPI003905E4EA